MPTELPIACSLSAAEMEQRAERWRRLAGEALLGSSYEERVARLRWRAEPAVERELRELVRLEGECCPFLDLKVAGLDGDLLLEISGPPEAEQIVAAFAAAPEPSSRPS
jgi:hypothetical protein